jgi:abequosyltransferase
MSHVPLLRLSVCIATFNRAEFIGDTLSSILTQVTQHCEVVVLDCASTDGTQELIAKDFREFDRLRYIRQESNNGIDRDYDRVVTLALGEYCWLMTDDDLLKPGAIESVLGALSRDPSLVIVNAEIRDFSMSKILQRRRLDFRSDRTYGPGESDRLFEDVGDTLTYIGGTVIKREVWMTRERSRYYNSFYIHIGVIFQQALPRDALFIAEPLISYRMGNLQTFSPKAIEILWVKWPSLVRSLALSGETKSKVCDAEPWTNLGQLVWRRAQGHYSLAVYQRFVRHRLRSRRQKFAPVLVAILPGVFVNLVCLLYYSVRRHQHGLWAPDVMLYSLRYSRFHPWRW